MFPILSGAKFCAGSLTSPTFQGDQSCILYFFWNLHGSDIGTLQVDTLVVGTFWRNDIWNMSYNQGDSWRLGSVRLSTLQATPVTSQVRITGGENVDYDSLVLQLCVSMCVVCHWAWPQCGFLECSQDNMMVTTNLVYFVDILVISCPFLVHHAMHCQRHHAS